MNKLQLEALGPVMLLVARELFLIAPLLTGVDDKIHGHASERWTLGTRATLTIAFISPLSWRIPTCAYNVTRR